MKPIRTLLSLVLLCSMILAACSPAEPAAATSAVTPTLSNQSIINTSVAATAAGLSKEVASLKKTIAAPTQASTAQPDGTNPTGSAAQPAGTPQVAFAQATAATHTAGICDFAAFVQDITIPDGTTIPPNQAFTKTWAIKNVGKCAWTPKYSLIYSGGDLMGASETMPLTQANIAPGETAYISIEFTAPNDAALHSSFWKIRNADGGIFGVVDAAGKETPIWVNIRTSKTYSFTDNLCLAAWMAAGDQQLNCPGNPEDLSGTAYITTTSRWSDGKYRDAAVLAMVPPPGEDTVITGQYPAMVVPEWAHFKTSISCAYGKKECSARVRITYSENGGPEQVLFAKDMVYGKAVPVDIMLGKQALFNKTVSFIFHVTANGDASQDLIYFLNPRLEP